MIRHTYAKMLVVVQNIQENTTKTNKTKAKINLI